MPKVVVSRISLEINGQVVPNLVSVKPGKVPYAEKIESMDGPLVAEVPPEFPFTAVYLIPKNAPTFDFKAAFAGGAEGTLTIDYRNGERRAYRNVSLLSSEESDYDGKKGASITLELLADGEI